MVFEKTSATGSTPEKQFAENFRKFVDAFGPVDGPTLLAEGCTYRGALERQVDKLEAEHQERQREIRNLERRLKAVDLGEDEVLSGGA